MRMKPSTAGPTLMELTPRLREGRDSEKKVSGYV